MTKPASPQHRPAFGFLTVVEHAQHGLFGGYLLLNALGRPLEFHCTAPVKPNRAQQILFGPTLRDYLYGEQIGQTLVSKAGLDAEAIFTDVPGVLAMQSAVASPVLLVMGGDGTSTAGQDPGGSWRIDGPHRAGPSLATFRAGRHQLAASLGSGDAQALAERLGALEVGFDLDEPFGRIREAIDEAQRGGG